MPKKKPVRKRTAKRPAASPKPARAPRTIRQRVNGAVPDDAVVILLPQPPDGRNGTQIVVQNAGDHYACEAETFEAIYRRFHAGYAPSFFTATGIDEDSSDFENVVEENAVRPLSEVIASQYCRPGHFYLWVRGDNPFYNPSGYHRAQVDWRKNVKPFNTKALAMDWAESMSACPNDEREARAIRSAMRVADRLGVPAV